MNDASQHLTWTKSNMRLLEAIGNEFEMMNLVGTQPKGNSIQSMGLGFALQARSLELQFVQSLQG